MSFPSVERELQNRGLASAALTAADIQAAREALLAAVRTDCPEAVEYLHGLAHKAKKDPDGILWTENPNSVLGKQLIRIHASTPVRRLVEEHICHGMELTFYNCCGGKVAQPKPKDERDRDAEILMQIQMQAGPVAYADC